MYPLTCPPCHRDLTHSEVQERRTIPAGAYLPARVYLRIRCRQCRRLYEHFVPIDRWREDLLDGEPVNPA